MSRLPENRFKLSRFGKVNILNDNGNVLKDVDFENLYK